MFHKFKIKVMVAIPPESGRKMKPIMIIYQTYKQQLVRNPQLTAKDRQQDYVAAEIEVSVFTKNRETPNFKMHTITKHITVALIRKTPQEDLL